MLVSFAILYSLRKTLQTPEFISSLLQSKNLQKYISTKNWNTELTLGGICLFKNTASENSRYFIFYIFLMFLSIQYINYITLNTHVIALIYICLWEFSFFLKISIFDGKIKTKVLKKNWSIHLYIFHKHSQVLFFSDSKNMIQNFPSCRSFSLV